MSYYIATRASFGNMETALGHPVSRLNQKLSVTLRQAAMSLDIKQNTKDGGRLEFYSVSDEDYARLIDPHQKLINLLKDDVSVRPLASMVTENLQKALAKVNSQYTGRMDYKTHQKYLSDLKKATSALLIKLEDDVKPQREAKPKLAANPYKVGDLFTADWEYSAPKEFEKYANCRVARVSNAYVWLEYVGFKKEMNISGAWSNTESAKKVFKKAKGYGKGGMDDHGHFIPLKDNQFAFEWVPVKNYKGQLVRQRWDKVAGYRVKHLGQKGEVGYCYSYTPSYD
jgi:hypothetical protein